MQGAYESLMRAAQDGMPGAGGMQATPVHHVGKGTMDEPEKGSIKDQAMGFLSEIEGELGKYRPGSHAHNQLMSIRGDLIKDISDMDVEHQLLGDPDALSSIMQRYQNLQGRTVAPQRGITPQGKPVR